MIKFVFFLLLFPLISFARPTIEVPAAVEISQRKELRLGDIALVTGARESLLRELQGIVVMADGRELLISQKLSSATVLKAFRAALSQSSSLKEQNPILKVPSEVQVSFSKQAISREEVTRNISNYLRTKCSDCEYSVTVQSTPQPLGENWNIDYSQVIAKGGVLIPILENENRSSKFISANIRVSKLTPVSKKLIKQGERLKSEDFELSEVNITFAKDATLRLEDLEGQIAARDFAVGSPVWANDLKRETAAKRGQVVKVIISEGDFEVTTDMVAQETGYIGDTISLRSTDTKKNLSGVIKEKGLVQIL